MNAYEEIYKLTTDKVEHYRTDFAIDEQGITDHREIPFIHVAREMGTHIYFLIPADYKDWPKKGNADPYLFGKATREQILQSTTGMVEYSCKNPDHLIHIYDGETITEVSGEYAVGFWGEYADEVSQTWRNDANL